MKAVIVNVPQDVLEERRRRGLDPYDEVWDGVLHMVPPPSKRHQDIVSGLLEVLRPYARRHGMGKVYPGLGVRDPGKGEGNYRVPDLILLASGEESLLDSQGEWVDGGPSAVIEVRSPGDETYEKMPFYAAIGAREFVVIECRTCKAESYRLAGASYVAAAPASDGWLRCEALKVSFRTEEGRLNLRLELDGREDRIPF